MKPVENHIAAFFNKAASTYYKYANVQEAAGRLLINTLILYRRHFPFAADAGCGTGHITNVLYNKIVCQNLYAIDYAEEMLHQSKQFPNIMPIHLDFNRLSELNLSLDLIFSNMALHWSSDLAQTLMTLHQSLNQNGMLAFTIPLDGTFREISSHCATHNFKINEEINKLLNNASFTILHCSNHTFTDTFPDTLSALRSLKRTGTTFVPVRTRKSLPGKSLLTTLKTNHLTYELGFFIARKT